jgi:hypothetical protein
MPIVKKKILEVPEDVRDPVRLYRGWKVVENVHGSLAKCRSFNVRRYSFHVWGGGGGEEYEVCCTCK